MVARFGHVTEFGQRIAAVALYQAHVHIFGAARRPACSQKAPGFDAALWFPAQHRLAVPPLPEHRRPGRVPQSLQQFLFGEAYDPARVRAVATRFRAQLQRRLEQVVGELVVVWHGSPGVEADAILFDHLPQLGDHDLHVKVPLRVIGTVQRPPDHLKEVYHLSSST